MSEGNLWQKFERWMESSSAFYTAFGVMGAVGAGILIYWFGFYT